MAKMTIDDLIIQLSRYSSDMRRSVQVEIIPATDAGKFEISEFELSSDRKVLAIIIKPSDDDQQTFW